MGRLSRVRQDKEKVKNGVWRTFEGIRFLLRPTNNPDHVERMQQVAFERFGVDQMGALTTAQLGEVFVAAMPGTVVLNWDQMEEEDKHGKPTGKMVPYSDDFCLQILESEEFVEILSFVERNAGSTKTFRVRALGNLQPSLGGGETAPGSDEN